MHAMRTGLHLAVIAMLLLIVLGCSDKKPTQPFTSDQADNPFSKPGSNTGGPDQVFGRVGLVNESASAIVLQGGRTEVTVKADASIAQSDERNNTTSPLAMGAIAPGDSVEFRGIYLSYGSAVGGTSTKGSGSDKNGIANDDSYTPAIFLADQVTIVLADTVVPSDTLPVGLTLELYGTLNTVNLDQGTITFTDRPYTGQTTPATVYHGMFMSPIITLANFAPGMNVKAVGKTAGNWVLTLDSLIQLPPPPDSTNPPDTLPPGPVNFRDVIRTVDTAANTITFTYSPYIGQLSESTQVNLRSLILCSSAEDCVWPGMHVEVTGHTAEGWLLYVDRLDELETPPDSTIPPDTIPAGTRVMFEDQIRMVDTMSGNVWFNWHPYSAMVTGATYYNGEFEPGTVPSLRNFLPGSYVRVSGVFDDNTILIIDTLTLNDFLPPDTTYPPDTTDPGDTTWYPPNDTTYPPSDSGYAPIHGTIYLDFEYAEYPDSMGGPGDTRTFIVAHMQTEEQFACPQVYIAGILDQDATGATLKILGVPPYECFAYEPGPANTYLPVGFESPTFTMSFSYQGKTDTYVVTVSNKVATATPVGTPAFTALKDL